MSQARQPDDRPDKQPMETSAADTQPETPDLIFSDWEDFLMPQDADQPIQQSLFSSRSGIRDLLTAKGKEGSDEPDIPDEMEDDTPTLQDAVQAENISASAAAPPAQKGRRLRKSRRQTDRVRRRQMNYLQERREQKKRMVFYGRLRLVFKLAFGIIWAILLWELVHSPLWIYKAPRFALKDQHLIQANQVEALIRPLVGKPIYAIDTGALAGRIERRFELAERVSVRRKLFPTRLEVTIQEKTPWAEIYAGNPNPKPATPQTPAKNKPVRPYGLLVPKAAINLAKYRYNPSIYKDQALEKLIVAPRTKLSGDYLDRVREVAWQARQISGLHLESVDIRKPDHVVLNFREMPVILGRLNNSASERMGRLVPLVPKIQELRNFMASVDLRWEEQVTFHKKPNTTLPKPKSAE